MFIVSILIAYKLFSYGMSFPLRERVRGDAYLYMSIAYNFSSFWDGVSYVGQERTSGYPIFLYLVKVIFSPKHLKEWAYQVAYIQVFFHILASVCFYKFFLTDLFRQKKLLKFSAVLITCLLIIYPTLVTYTTTPLTDTFTTDLIMIFIILYYKSYKGSFYLSALSCGIVLGYLILVRPSLWPPVLVFYTICVCMMILKRRNFISKTNVFIMMMSTLIILTPSFYYTQQKYGHIGIRNTNLVEEIYSKDLQAGLSAVRVFWSRKYISANPIYSGIHDPLLMREYGLKCNVVSLPEILKCLFEKPKFVPVFIFKKMIGLFDDPQLQPYIVDFTPRWFILWQRVFGMLSFCGFLSLIYITILNIFYKNKTFAIDLPLSMFMCTLIGVHMILHIEGRYGFSVIPLSITALFLSFTYAKELEKRRSLAIWMCILTISGMLFLYQTHHWDLTPPM